MVARHAHVSLFHGCRLFHFVLIPWFSISVDNALCLLSVSPITCKYLESIFAVIGHFTTRSSKTAGLRQWNQMGSRIHLNWHVRSKELLHQLRADKASLSISRAQMNFCKVHVNLAPQTSPEPAQKRNLRANKASIPPILCCSLERAPHGHPERLHWFDGPGSTISSAPESLRARKTWLKRAWARNLINTHN